MNLKAKDEYALNFVNYGYNEKRQGDLILWVVMICLGLCTCYLCTSTYPLAIAFLIVLYVASLLVKIVSAFKKYARLYLADGLLFASYSCSLQVITSYLFYSLSGYRLLSLCIVCVLNIVEVILIWLYTITRINRNLYAPERMAKGDGARFKILGVAGALVGWSMARQIFGVTEDSPQLSPYSVFSALTLILALLLNFGSVFFLKFYFYIRLRNKYDLDK